jgi:hypothetical protein
MVTEPEAPVDAYLSPLGDNDTLHADSTPAALLSKLSFFPISSPEVKSHKPVVPSIVLNRALVP